MSQGMGSFLESVFAGVKKGSCDPLETECYCSKMRLFYKCATPDNEAILTFNLLKGK